jgi:predicted transcriptional regulator of viral defense system
VISHESALALYEMSDANPSKLHITVPRSFRIRREVPGYLVVHHADLQPYEIRPFEGIPVTAPERTIRDCHARHLSRGLIRQAIDDARRQGYLSMRDAAGLQDELGQPGPEGER